MKINAGNIQKGEFIKHNNEIWHVQKANFYSPGKGSALMRTSLRNIISGRTLNFTFKSNDSIETVEIETKKMQYLYKDQTSLYFMDEANYDQLQLDLKVVGTVADYLKEGVSLLVLLYDGKPVNIRPPLSVKLKVIEAETSAKGNTLTSPKKLVKLETGASLNVPIFIKIGDIVVVKPETGEYLERASS